jgi:endoglycosylceramidase
MRRPLALLLALAATLAAVPVAAGRGHWRGGWADAGIVQAPGGSYLTDALGRRLELHGVNLVAKCGGGAVPIDVPGTPCVGPAQGPRLAYVLSPAARDPARRFTAADARTLVRLGFNTVRLGIIWEGLEPGPAAVQPNDPRYCAPHHGTHFQSLGRADPYDPATVGAYLRRTDRIIGLLARLDIRVVLDMHQDVWGSAFQYPYGLTPWSGEGAPPWATCTNGLAFDAPVGWGSGYTAPAVQAAIHHFWANDVRADLQGQFARVWTAVAEHYAGDPDVLGYEVINEPNDYSPKAFYPELQCDYGGPVHEPRSCRASRAAALPDGLIGSIQTADPGHVVLFEPSGDTDFGALETLGMAEPLRFNNLALAFHVYGYPPDQLRETAQERAQTRTRQPGGPAWIMDEFGASNNSPATAQAVALADASNLGWAYWSALQLDDPTAGDAYEGLLDQITRKPFPSQARALAVPYPWATAGTPGRQSFNPVTGTFRYTYRLTPNIPADTEIELPPYVYPHGYSVRVQGAHVVSGKGAPVLELSALKRARRVSVTVWRR